MKFKLLIYYILYTGCTLPTANYDYPSNLRIEVDLKLPQDVNKYYRLPLDTTRIQTIHAIHGGIFPPVHYKRLEWDTNISWKIEEYEFKPVNPTSYSNQKGTFGNVLGPVVYMKGDTMALTVRWDPKDEMDSYYNYNPTESKTFFIILE